MSKNEIIIQYQNHFSDIQEKFPIDSEKLFSIHKSAIKSIMENLNLKNFSPESQRQIDLEYKKISSQNLEIFKSQLLSYLSEKFKDIDGNVHSGYYKSIDEYKNDIDKFKENVLKFAPEGPNRDSLIFKFILDQIIIDTEIIINSNVTLYENELNDKENILKKINCNIKD